MKIYKTQQEVEKDIKNSVLAIEGDVKFECSISIDANIIITNGNITAMNITAMDINAMNINAGNINAGDINARDITAMDISYYAFCSVYQNIKCLSIKSRRVPSQDPICLEGKLEIIDEKKSLSGKTVKVELDGVSYEAVIK